MSDAAPPEGLEPREPDRLARVPVPSELIGEPWEGMWTDAVDQLQAQGTWRVTDAPILLACIQARQQAAELRDDARANPTCIGSTGQIVAHPMFAVILRHEQTALALAQSLMLTASARVARNVDGGKLEPEAPVDEFADLDDEVGKQRRKRAAG